jgi:hypothetical protein
LWGWVGGLWGWWGGGRGGGIRAMVWVWVCVGVCLYVIGWWGCL